MNLAHQIRKAAQARQADLVLQLCANGRVRGKPVFGEGWTDAAQAVLELALHIRLPHGRHGAWAQHLQLLQEVCTILEEGKAASGEPHDPAVEAMLLRARKLQGRGAT